jgi:hypothetical protein
MILVSHDRKLYKESASPELWFPVGVQGLRSHLDLANTCNTIEAFVRNKVHAPVTAGPNTHGLISSDSHSEGFGRLLWTPLTARIGAFLKRMK